MPTNQTNRKKKAKIINKPLFFKKFFLFSLNQGLIFLLIFFLPTQLGKHFFLTQSYVFGIRVDYLAPTIYFFDILAIILFLINFNYLLKFFIQKKVIFLFFLLIINSIFSLFPLISFIKVLRIFQGLGIFLIIKRGLFLKEKLPSYKTKLFITNAFLITTLIEFFLALGQFVTKKSLGGVFWFLGERTFSLSTPEIAKINLFGVEALRSYGTFSHPNSMAGFYLLLYFYYLTNQKEKAFFYQRFFILFFSSLLVLVSFSKLAISLWFLGNFLYYIHQSISCKFCLFARLLVFFMVAFVFINNKTDPLSLQNRIALIREWENVFDKKWFLGTGIGAYIKAKEVIEPANLPYFLITQPVHNVFLLILAEMGIVVFPAVFFFIFPWLKKLLSRNRLIFLVIFVTALFDHYWWSLPQNFFLLFVISGLTLF